MKFWTNVTLHKGKIFRRGIDEGTRVHDRLTYSPYLFLQSNKPNTKYKTLSGKNVERLNFETVWDQKEWMDRHEDVEGFEFHGCQNPITSFIYDNYPGEVKFDPRLINIAIFDIELDRMISGDNFMEEAPGAITTIALFINDQKYAFGVKPYKAPEDVKYFHCTDEAAMLDTFLEIWENANIDVISGYHCEGFDVPYLVNRIQNVLGYEAAERLSPFGIIKAKQVPDKFGRTKNTYNIVGCSVLDYMELYKKFTLQVHGQLESYALNFVAHFELGEKKIDYSQYKDLMELYEEDFQLFMDYNIHDVELIRRLDKKLKFFDLVFEMSYIAKCNYQDVLKTTPVWESLIHAYLMDRRIVLPPRKFQTSNFTIPGGYVKEPTPGLYRWIVSCDMTSLYPTIIMSYNISPETFAGKVSLPSIDDITLQDRQKGLNFASSDVSVTAGGSTYRRDKEGFLPALMRDIFERRKTYKKMMLAAMDQNEKTPSPELEAEIDSLKAKQMAYKILANSGYGALANQYFLFFSYDLAMSVTLTGQLTIKWVAKRINEYLNRVLKTTNVDYVVAVDTDSNYLKLEAIVEKLLPGETDHNKIVNLLDKFVESKLQPVIDEALADLGEAMNIFQNAMGMKRESIAATGLWTGKKRYAMTVLDNEGVRYSEPDLKVTGLETKRSSVPSMCREALEDCLRIILMKNESELIDYEEKFRKKFFASSFYDIASPRGLNGLEKYYDPVHQFKPKCPIHVKGAIVYNEWLRDKKLEAKYPKISDGEKIKYIYLRLPNRLKSEVVSCPAKVPDEMEIEKYIDYELQYEKTFLAPLTALAQVARWNITQEHTLDGAW